MQNAEFDHLVKSLLGDTPPRVWSLLVTIFGDLALPPGARLSGSCVNALTATIGIKPEATRVALHRLRKEGWIESHRDGRQSRYGLTGHGRAETLAVWDRVYAPTSTATLPRLVIDKGPSRSGADTARRVHIGPCLWIETGPTPTGTRWVLPLDNPADIPEWVRNSLCQTETQQASDRLANRLNDLRTQTGLRDLTRIQATALRITIVHEWRRLILRVPDFPDSCFPHGWKGVACRAALHDLLTQLPAASPDELNDL